MTIKITSEEIMEYEKLKTLSQIAQVKDKIKLFESKYKSSFEEFEKEVKSKEEDFEKWDDYIEWEAYLETLKSLKEKMVEIDNTQDIKIA